jgi:hypothetical protein
MATHRADEKLIEHLRKETPEILEEGLDFDALATKVITADPSNVDRALKPRTRKASAQPKPKLDAD